MSDITERLDHLKKTIQEDDFLQGKGLSNEVNIRMFCWVCTFRGGILTISFFYVFFH